MPNLDDGLDVRFGGEKEKKLPRNDIAYKLVVQWFDPSVIGSFYPLHLNFSVEV